MWTQNATNSTPLYARSTATVNMSNHVGFQHFPGVDCYSHQGQLLGAGCWKELTETKTWIKHILACHVNAKCNKLDASICTIHCHCEHVKPCWFSTFSWCRLLQPPGTAATSWMLNRVDRNENLNQTYLHAICERKMQQTRRPNLHMHDPLPLWTCQTMLAFNIFLELTVTATRGQLLRAGCWKELTETKTWIIYTCMPCECKMQQIRRLYMHDPLPLWTCQTMLAFNIFLV